MYKQPYIQKPNNSVVADRQVGHSVWLFVCRLVYIAVNPVCISHLCPFVPTDNDQKNPQIHSLKGTLPRLLCCSIIFSVTDRGREEEIIFIIITYFSLLHTLTQSHSHSLFCC